jgi:hypothetical protein
MTGVAPTRGCTATSRFPTLSHSRQAIKCGGFRRGSACSQSSGWSICRSTTHLLLHRERVEVHSLSLTVGRYIIGSIKLPAFYQAVASLLNAAQTLRCRDGTVMCQTQVAPRVRRRIPLNEFIAHSALTRRNRADALTLNIASSFTLDCKIASRFHF